MAAAAPRPPGGGGGSTASGAYTIDYTASRASLIPFSLRIDLARGGGSPPVCDPAYGCIDY